VLRCPALLDLGTRRVGESVAAIFSIENIGGQPLEIREPKTNCTCHQLRLKGGGPLGRMSSFTVAPGAAADLEMTIRVAGTHGASMSGTVEFRTNDPERSIARVVAQVPFVLAGVFSSPSSITFGSLPVHETGHYTLEILDDGKSPRTVERLESTDPGHVRAQLSACEPVRAEDRQAWVIGRVEIDVSSDTPRDFDERIIVAVHGDRHVALEIPVTGRMVTPIEGSPSKLIFPMSSGTGPVYTGQFWIRSTSRLAIRAIEWSAPAGLVAEVLSGAEGPTGIVRVRWDPVIGAALTGSTPVVRFQVRTDSGVCGIELPVMCRKEAP
jgi:hypothetical protein